QKGAEMIGDVGECLLVARRSSPTVRNFGHVDPLGSYRDFVCYPMVPVELMKDAPCEAISRPPAARAKPSESSSPRRSASGMLANTTTERGKATRGLAFVVALLSVPAFADD